MSDSLAQSSTMEARRLPEFHKVTESPTNRATDDQLCILQTRYELAGRYAHDKDVLEVGCGAGVGLGMIARTARRVVGGDIDELNCAIASETYKGRPEIEVRRLNAESIQYPSASFDLVILFEALYYLSSPDAFFEEARRLLRPGGTLLISSVNCRWGGFNPSPFSTRYYDAAELTEALKGRGFGVSLYGSFSEETGGAVNRAVSALRKIAVALHLIPGSQKSKEWLKRIFYGQLKQIPMELTSDGLSPAPLDLLVPPYTSSHYRFIYCVATLGAEVPYQAKNGRTQESGKVIEHRVADPAGEFLAFIGSPENIDIVAPSNFPSLRVRCWRPRFFKPLPPLPLNNLGVEKMLNLAHVLLFFCFALFRGSRSAYRIAIATDESSTVRGFAVVRDRDFRFPFMGREDVQLGPVWTDANFRNRGLALKLCQSALRDLKASPRAVWWLCREDNDPSIAVARKLSLRLDGMVSRISLMGLPAPHFYRDLRPIAPNIGAGYEKGSKQ